MTITYPNVVGNLEVYLDVMRALCNVQPGDTMADLMCCTAPNTPKLGFTWATYYDIEHRILDHKECQHFFHRRNVIGMGDIGMKDCIICSDGIEHVSREDGEWLIKYMERNADRQVLFTPLDNIFGMVPDWNKDPEAHRSLWKPEDFPGYISVVFPDYHKVWNGGAFFVMRYSGEFYSMDTEFERIKQELSTKQWVCK